MEKFSVLMSVYYKERAEFFDLSLESILVNQTLRPDEFILVCDGELTPELEAVIEKNKNLAPDVLQVHRKENGGLGKALNFGLQKCSHPLVARADSDDVCASDRFEKQVHFMVEHPEYAVTSGAIAEFAENPAETLRVKTNPTTPEDAYEKCKVANPLNHMAVMFRKDVILELGSYQNVPLLEDYDLWTRTLLAGYKICNLPDVLVNARVGNGMVGRRSQPVQITGWMKINKNMLEHGMINRFTYVRNYILISGFVYMPSWIKNIAYSKLLRK